MEPIISPWIFYFVHVAGGLHTLTVLTGSVGTLVGGIMLIASAGDSSVIGEYGFKIGKRLLLVGVISLPLSIIIPDENTIYKMVAASYATPDNISAFANGTIEFIDKLTEAISRHIK